MTEDSKGCVKLSAQAIWAKDEHPEALDQHPTLKLKIELTEYSSRKAMADMLRFLANAVDDGCLHPFDPPLTNREVVGTWDGKKKQWIIEESDRP